jgi:PIN domain nuclease of toxin-antitoxin system
VILVDTHPIIWFTLGERQLGPKSRAIILEGAEKGTLALSPITFWEASMLVRKKRVKFEASIQEWADTILENGVALTGITSEIAIAAGQFPGTVHGDPADRILVATALALRCPLLTADRKILGYAQEGLVQAIDARL